MTPTAFLPSLASSTFVDVLVLVAALPLLALIASALVTKAMRGPLRSAGVGRAPLRGVAALAAVVVVVAGCGEAPPPAPAPDELPLATCTNPGGFSDGLPCDLRETHFDEATEFFPAATLWSDGAAKRRFITLPAGTTIDATDIDHWRFPKGTKLWKDITVDGVHMETRVLEKVGDDDESGWRMGSYVYDEQGRGVLTAAGADVNGWHVPASADCLQCHGNEPGRVLGYSAVELSKDDQLKNLVDESRLAPAPSQLHANVYTWEQPAQDAMLYLHANCGMCHQEGGIGTYGQNGQKLRIGFFDADATHTDAFTTTVNVDLAIGALDDAGTITKRIVAGDADHSGVYVRMQHRGDWLQMPMLGSDVVDAEGSAKVAAWINSLH